jgi:hypothetical protein
MTNTRFALGQKCSVAARMSLPLQWREWAIPLMLYGVRCSELGLTAHSDSVLPSDGDEADRAKRA